MVKTMFPVNVPLNQSIDIVIVVTTMTGVFVNMGNEFTI